jgi:peptidoglycan hydrolase CwlO-like protein
MTGYASVIEEERRLLAVRISDLQKELKKVQEQEHKIRNEIDEVNLQIDYYEHLTQDMKKDIHPPKLNRLLHGMRRT